MTHEQAVQLYQSKWWIGRDPIDIVSFQLFEDLLCTDWRVFQAAVETVLGRPVWIHEFAGKEGQIRLQQEFLKERPAPTLEDICNLIPEAKRIIVTTEES